MVIMEKHAYYFVYQPLEGNKLPTISFGGETEDSFEKIFDVVNNLLKLISKDYLLVLSNYQKINENEQKKK